MSTYFSKHIQAALLPLALAIAVGLILGVAIVHVTPIVVVVALLALFLVFLILKKPEFGILGYIVLFSTFFDSTANVGISLPFGHVYLSDILLLMLLLLIGVRSLVEPDFAIVHTPLDLLLIIFVGMAYLSTFVAINFSSLTLQQSLGEMRVVASYLLFFGVTNLIRNDGQLKFLIGTIVVLGSLVSVVMIIQYILGSSAIHIIAGRVEVLSTEGATVTDVTRIIPPGDALVFVGFVIVFAILWFEGFKPGNWILIVPALLMAFGILLTFKRHYWAAIIIISLIIIYLGGRRHLQSVFVGALSALVIAGMVLFYLMYFTGATGPRLISGSVTRLTSLADPRTYTDPNSSLRWRDFEDQYSLPQIAAHPLIGLGLGARYRPLVPPRDWAGFDGRAYIHNGHLWLLVKTGFLGYLPLLFVFIISLYRGFKYWRLIPDPRKRLYVLGFTLALMGMLIGSWVEPTLMEASWTPVIGLILGCNEVVLSKLSSKNANPDQ